MRHGRCPETHPARRPVHMSRRGRAGFVAAVAILFAAQRGRAAQEAPLTVAVDVSSLDARSFRELDALALEKAVMVRLVQDGFAVVSPSADPQVSVRVRKQGAHLLVEARGRQGDWYTRPVALTARHL